MNHSIAKVRHAKPHFSTTDDMIRTFHISSTSAFEKGNTPASSPHGERSEVDHYLKRKLQCQ